MIKAVSPEPKGGSTFYLNEHESGNQIDNENKDSSQSEKAESVIQVKLETGEYEVALKSNEPGLTEKLFRSLSSSHLYETKTISLSDVTVENRLEPAPSSIKKSKSMTVLKANCNFPSVKHKLDDLGRPISVINDASYVRLVDEAKNEGCVLEMGEDVRKRRWTDSPSVLTSLSPKPQDPVFTEHKSNSEKLNRSSSNDTLLKAGSPQPMPEQSKTPPPLRQIQAHKHKHSFFKRAASIKRKEKPAKYRNDFDDTTSSDGDPEHENSQDHIHEDNDRKESPVSSKNTMRKSQGKKTTIEDSEILNDTKALKTGNRKSTSGRERSGSVSKTRKKLKGMDGMDSSTSSLGSAANTDNEDSSCDDVARKNDPRLKGKSSPSMLEKRSTTSPTLRQSKLNKKKEIHHHPEPKRNIKDYLDVEVITAELKVQLDLRRSVYLALRNSCINKAGGKQIL